MPRIARGRTALLYAAAEGHLDVVDYLLLESADLNLPDKEGVHFAHGSGG